MSALDKPSNIFLTGGTGFLGKRLLARLAAQPNATVYALCRKGSESKLNQLFMSNPELNANVRPVQGDVTLPRLGLGPEIVEALGHNEVEIFHCAAAYDLAVTKEKAQRVNTEGTRNALDFAASLKSLRRFHHISTIIVSGDRAGVIRENELDEGQGFKNFYEFSKFHAEKEVVKRSEQFPVTIYRPAVIIGDSRDGSIDKFDGPYFGLSLMLRGLPMLIPGSGEVPLHLAPVDFVADAITEIAKCDDTIGKTFHLCDPHPVSACEFVLRGKELLQTRAPVLHVPVKAMRLLAALPLFSWITKMPTQILPYMYQETKYDMTNAAEILQRSGIECPPIEEYLGKIVQFFRMNFPLNC